LVRVVVKGCTLGDLVPAHRVSSDGLISFGAPQQRGMLRVVAFGSFRDRHRGRCRLGRADGRAVVMGCDEPLAGVLGSALEARSGLVRTGHAGGRFEMLQALLWMGWRAVTLSRGCHKRRETWWDRGGCAETIYARRREWGRWWNGWNGLAVIGCQGCGRDRGAGGGGMIVKSAQRRGVRGLGRSWCRAAASQYLAVSGRRENQRFGCG
jgi:hypothetical protein